MLLGIVLHGSIPYFSELLGFQYSWPADEAQSWLLFLIFHFIHAWRMPVFFLLAGFFANLVIVKRGLPTFLKDRCARIGLPLMLFAPVMAVTMPLIWHYGFKGQFTFYFTGFQSEIHSEFLAHLWFLYYLCLLYPVLVGGKIALDRIDGFPLLKRTLQTALYTRVPILLLILATFLFIVRAQGGEAKPIWPLNLPDLVYMALFFYYGYGLYEKRHLIDSFKSPGMVFFFLTVALVAYIVNLASLSALDVQGSSWWLETLAGLSYTALNISCCLGFIGVFEALLQSNNPKVRWIADSSYWIYIMHMPVISLCTFFLAHNLSAPAWVEFLVSCGITVALGFISYQYLVRKTPLGWLLTGKRR